MVRPSEAHWGWGEEVAAEKVMVVSRTVVLGKPCKEARKRDRRKLGKLRENVVKACTLTRYKNSVLVFLAFVRDVLEVRLRSRSEVDVAAYHFIEEL
jgi:hypothetical protein